MCGACPLTHGHVVGAKGKSGNGSVDSHAALATAQILGCLELGKGLVQGASQGGVQALLDGAHNGLLDGALEEADQQVVQPANLAVKVDLEAVNIDRRGQHGQVRTAIHSRDAQRGGDGGAAWCGSDRACGRG